VCEDSWLALGRRVAAAAVRRRRQAAKELFTATRTRRRSGRGRRRQRPVVVAAFALRADQGRWVAIRSQAMDCDRARPTRDCRDRLDHASGPDRVCPKLTTGFSTAAEKRNPHRLGQTNQGRRQHERRRSRSTRRRGLRQASLSAPGVRRPIVVTSKASYGSRRLRQLRQHRLVIEIGSPRRRRLDRTCLSTSPGFFLCRNPRNRRGDRNDGSNVPADVTGDVFSSTSTGRSGTIKHGVTSADPNYNGIVEAPSGLEMRAEESLEEGRRRPSILRYRESYNRAKATRRSRGRLLPPRLHKPVPGRPDRDDRRSAIDR